MHRTCLPFPARTASLGLALSALLAFAPRTVAAEAPDARTPAVTGPTPRLVLPGMESLEVGGRPAFVVLPPSGQRSRPQPWVFYAPTLPAYPDGAERWMHERFLEAGVAVAGVDVGEAYGSPASHAAFEALHRELVGNRGFAVASSSGHTTTFAPSCHWTNRPLFAVWYPRSSTA